MLPITPPETKRRLYKWPAVYRIPSCLDSCAPAYIGGAIERVLMLIFDRIWEYGASHIAHFVIYLFTNPNQSDMDRGGLPRTKTNMPFYWGSGVTKMRNELRGKPARAYGT